MSFRIIDIEPNSQAWHDWRREGIGGSDADIIMKTSKYETTVEQLMKIKMGLVEPPVASWQMEEGRKNEPIAREIYEREHEILMPEMLVESVATPFIKATLDGFNLTLGRALEIKCVGWENHQIAVSGKIPPQYHYQCVHICMVTGAEELDYFSYLRPEWNKVNRGKAHFAKVTYRRNKRHEEKLFKREIEFWECALNYQAETEMTHERVLSIKPKWDFPVRAK